MTQPPDPLRSPALEHKTLLWLVVGFSAAFLLVLWPLAGAVLWALFLALVFWPMHLRTRRLVRRPSVAALLTVMSIVLIVIVPLFLVSASVVDQTSVLVEKVRGGEIQPTEYLQRMMHALPQWATGILQRLGLDELPALLQRASEVLQRSGQAITTGLLGIGQFTLDFVVSFFIMLYVLFFLLRDGTALSNTIADAVPLQPAQTRKLLGQFVTVVRATVKGNVVVAVIQGTLGGLAFWVLDVPGPALWGALMALLSLLPAVGAALVWGPVALYKLFTGDLVGGIGLTVWGVLVIGLVDNVLRPVLVGRDTRMPDYLVLVATVGGISLFGLNGFVIGPVIAAMFLVCWKLLTEVRQQLGHSSQRDSAG
ncbi:MAG TPA: AI-2E family transporter [Ramlibacter sp.]|jgi:predicted PurR-regulated permease PerM|uniref:AI-2E family transporter n=1 Tax=Ramlibacter sp. TaxID=1917967 RepID=UPI002D270045|nr:AI-2E family transporter [Ramlibacter sp.]HZY17508.1 AI-2E family transporter [Ramlibacter sp.]